MRATFHLEIMTRGLQNQSYDSAYRRDRLSHLGQALSLKLVSCDLLNMRAGCVAVATSRSQSALKIGQVFRRVRGGDASLRAEVLHCSNCKFTVVSRSPPCRDPKHNVGRQNFRLLY